MHVASIEGIEGLTLGRLAEVLHTSKSGIQTLFGTKQELQLSIVAAASHVFECDVLLPAERQQAGLPRLRALMSYWIDYLEIFEGDAFSLLPQANSTAGPDPSETPSQSPSPGPTPCFDARSNSPGASASSRRTPTSSNSPSNCMPWCFRRITIASFSAARTP